MCFLPVHQVLLDLDPLHFHFFRERRRGELGSLAALGCFFIWPADLAQYCAARCAWAMVYPLRHTNGLLAACFRVLTVFEYFAGCCHQTLVGGEEPFEVLGLNRATISL